MSVQEGHCKYTMYCGKKSASTQVSIQEGHISINGVYTVGKNDIIPRSLSRMVIECSMECIQRQKYNGAQVSIQEGHSMLCLS